MKCMDFPRDFLMNLTNIAGFTRLLKILVDLDEWYVISLEIYQRRLTHIAGLCEAIIKYLWT